MRVVVIGGTGHIGTYLVPRLVEAGHEVVALSRGQREPYRSNAAWKAVEQQVVDRASEEEDGSFGTRVRDLKPDVVIDLISFTLPSTQQIVEALRGNVQHFLHCGTIWVHGPSAIVPTTEAQPRRPFGEYGVKKAAIETFLLDESRRHHFPASVLHPGHIVGPGWAPLNPEGHFSTDTWGKIARGEEIKLPNLGLETVHHVHADDVALAFMCALTNWNSAVGESFHVVSPAALTLRGYAEAMARWFGQPANLAFVPWEQLRKELEPNQANAIYDHIAHSPNCSISKAQRLIGYQPRYSSLEAVIEAVTWLRENGRF